ncbi:MAG: hypothetical protein EP344_11030 [Bacteroidetes bacterium]|nr:MAG: hypothetical protein EP344_11030 [Bacteroidota bacterium]
MRLLFFFLLCLPFTLSCTAQQVLTSHSLNLDSNHTLVLLDSADAAKTLLLDETDRFFDRVTASEMSIQMKTPLENGQTRADLLPAFRDFLQRDVESFTPGESKLVSEVMQDMFINCSGLSSDLFPDTLILIKTKANHYGNSVYYTRENTIVIPADVLQNNVRGAFASTMYHELFHVYSRLNPEKRRQLYRLIGFESIGMEHLKMPKALAERVLYNPDGVDFAQRITLKDAAGNIIYAVPIIVSKNLGYTASRPAFFSYVVFDLYEVRAVSGQDWVVITKDDGFRSTLNLRDLPDFYKQIKENTTYIIHPDEILADNFMFLMRAQKDTNANARFSDEGRQLIADIERIITETN